MSKLQSINSFGNFISKFKQIIKPTYAIIFEKCDNIVGFDFKNMNNYITILKSGLYIVNLNAQFTDNCHVGLFINDLPDLSTRTCSKSGIINIYQVLNLFKNDKLSIKNNSLYPITTMNYNKCNNINLNITQI